MCFKASLWQVVATNWPHFKTAEWAFQEGKVVPGVGEESLTCVGVTGAAGPERAPATSPSVLAESEMVGPAREGGTQWTVGMF